MHFLFTIVMGQIGRFLLKTMGGAIQGDHERISTLLRLAMATAQISPQQVLIEAEYATTPQ